MKPNFAVAADREASNKDDVRGQRGEEAAKADDPRRKAQGTGMAVLHSTGFP